MFEETKRERYASVDRLFKPTDEDDDKYRRESDSDSDKSSDGLSEITNESIYFEKKISYQRRALFRKNFTL